MRCTVRQPPRQGGWVRTEPHGDAAASVQRTGQSVKESWARLLCDAIMRATAATPQRPSSAPVQALPTKAHHVKSAPPEPTAGETLEAAPSMGARATLQRLIHARRSIRHYQEIPVERALLEELLEAATWAPSAHNRQPWRFCVVQGTMRQTLSAAMAPVWLHDLLADGGDAAKAAAHVAERAARIARAPAVIVACLSMADMDVYPDARRAASEHTMAVQSVALACQNLLMTTHAAGLGACWLCAPLFVPETVRAVLALPADWEPQALITLGWPAEVKEKARAPLAARILWRND